MRTKGIFHAAFVAFLFVGTQSALAQRTADMSLTVTANNLGIFTCSITSSATFDFGDVDADGTLSSTGIAGVRNGANDGADYEALSAAQWQCNAAPSSTVDIKMNSTGADHSGAGGMGADNLTVRMPTATAGGGTSLGYRDFTSGLDLLTGISVGNGALTASGNIDLNLSVLDTDATGANTWVVKLRATGTP